MRKFTKMLFDIHFWAEIMRVIPPWRKNCFTAKNVGPGSAHVPANML